MLRLKASDLAEAARPATPNPRKKHIKPVPVLLEFDQESGLLAVTEAKFGTFGKQIPAAGEWPDPVQVDCVLLARLSKILPGDAVLEVSAGPDAVIVTGDSTHRIVRLDLKKTRRAIKPPSLRSLRNAFRLPGT